jgi:hypothetical protein
VHNVEFLLMEEIQNRDKRTWQQDVIIPDNPDVLAGCFCEALEDISISPKIGPIAKVTAWNVAGATESFDDCRGVVWGGIV